MFYSLDLLHVIKKIDSGAFFLLYCNLVINLYNLKRSEHLFKEIIEYKMETLFLIK